MTQRILLIALFLFGCSLEAITTKQSTKEYQAVLAQLGSTLNDTLYHMNAAIEKLQNMLDMEEIQNQEEEKTIVELRAQLASLEQQKNQEIATLQEQLAQSAHELELLEIEYNEQIDTYLAYEQDFYNMLQIIKKEYMGLLDDQDEFFQNLELFIDKAHSQAEDMTTEVYDALQNNRASE